MDQKIKGIVVQYIMITLSCALYAVAFNWFFDPNHLSVGGFTGIAQIVNFFLPQAPIGAVIVVLNLPLFILSWKHVGHQWLYATLYATLVSSGMIDLLAGLYTFKPMEPLLAAICGGVAAGLPRVKAQEYAAQMVLGSARMVLESGSHPGALKDAVCSPGGSTIQGVRLLEERAFRGAVTDAVLAAYEKTKDLGK